MNKHFSLLIHSTLIVGALLPLSPLNPTFQPEFQSEFTSGKSIQLEQSSEGLLVAYGRGVPRFRSGGGTR